MTTLGNIMNKHKTNRNYPLLILCGDSDNSLAVEMAQKWNRDEPGSIFRQINNAGHCANMDNPTEFNSILDEFISIYNKKIVQK